VLQWLVEAADQAAAFSRYCLHDVRVTQVQLNELFTLLRAVKAREVSEPEAIHRLSRSPHWVWGALDPGTKLLLTHFGPCYHADHFSDRLSTAQDPVTTALS